LTGAAIFLASSQVTASRISFSIGNGKGIDEERVRERVADAGLEADIYLST
jgi:hypothetical protein